MSSLELRRTSERASKVSERETSYTLDALHRRVLKDTKVREHKDTHTLLLSSLLLPSHPLLRVNLHLLRFSSHLVAATIVAEK